MSIVTLIELRPRGAGDAVTQVIRLVHNARASGRFLGQQWLPGHVARLPDFELDLGFDGEKFGQGATPQVGQLVLVVPISSSWASLAWKGAEVTLRTAPWPTYHVDPADGAFGAAVNYRVEDVSCSADGRMTLTLIDLGRALRNSAQPAKFGSSADPLLDGVGAIDHRGKVVPIGYGRLYGVPALLVDRVYNIYLLIARPTSVFHGIYDGGADWAPGIVRADLAALRANTPADGAVDVCGNAGGLTLIRPWTTPTYALTADITASGPVTAANIATTIVAARAAVPFAAGTVAAFNALQPATCGLYINDERSAATALDELICRLGGFWRVNDAGAIELGRLDFAAPAVVFGAHQLLSIERKRIVMPTRRRSVGYGRNNRVHSEGEIAGILLAGDIDGLGGLAYLDNLDWALVTGAGRPADNATVGAPAGSNVAGTPAATLVTNAANALATANSAASTISIIVSDGYLARGEKPALIKEWTAIYNESSVLAARAATLSLSGHATYSSYSAAYLALSTYLGGLSPAYDNTALDTPIVGATFRGKFTDYFYARQLLLDLFTATTKAAADAAQATADNKTRNVHVGVWDDVAIGFPFSIGEEVERYGCSWTVKAAHAKTAVNGPPLPPATSNALWAMRTKAGADGANGVSSFAVTPSLGTWTVPCDSAGAPLADAFTGATGRLQCRYAGADVSASCTFAAQPHTAAAGSIDAAGNYTITDIGALVGKLVFRATYDPPGAAPVEQVDIVIQVVKSIRGAAAIEVADNSIDRPTSADQVVSDPLVIPAGPGGSISISATMGFFGTGGGSSANVRMKAQKRLAGTSDPYVDVTAYVTGSMPSVKDGEGIWNGGSAAYTTSVSGPAAQEFWQLRLVASPVGALAAGGFTGAFKVSRAS
jgi:hypothetical protein